MKKGARNWNSGHGAGWDPRKSRSPAVNVNDQISSFLPRFLETPFRTLRPLSKETLEKRGKKLEFWPRRRVGSHPTRTDPRIQPDPSSNPPAQLMGCRSAVARSEHGYRGRTVVFRPRCFQVANHYRPGACRALRSTGRRPALHTARRKGRRRCVVARSGTAHGTRGRRIRLGRERVANENIGNAPVSKTRALLARCKLPG